MEDRSPTTDNSKQERDDPRQPNASNPELELCLRRFAASARSILNIRMAFHSERTASYYRHWTLGELYGCLGHEKELRHLHLRLFTLGYNHGIQE
jgi:hypothetical protein